MKRAILRFLAAGLLVSLAACQAKVPSLEAIQDSRLLDRRIEETPRQKTLRECRQEGERFRVDCKHCHSTQNPDEIQSPAGLQLTQIGQRARIMRSSATFGLHQQCSVCHQSKFSLTVHAQRLFGPGGERRRELEKAMQSNSMQ